ncbi:MULTISPECIES: response regulator [Rhodanobacter]|uniref:response regulator n=1 Tax=Rhodanobacter TaxID=75309 RepID=UPI000409F34B|nr:MULTISPECIES: response regulator [Rhodanobacter]TAN18866.1 MAG: response regulator [Rhodanobacter sp.]UJJ54003.1 response regulator [Rhodanobacter thiooxydans]
MDGHALMNGLGFFKRLLGSQTAGGHRVEPQAALGARMLVVDDSPTICAVLGKMLHQDGYAVLKATGGVEAIELARRERPALIFLDVVMPGTNGFAVLRTLRHDPLTRDIPIVMISGNPQATEQFYLQRFGADDFMQKPFDRDEVYLRIGQLVRSGRLDGRLPTAPAATAALPALAEELSADELADIPDIAMPDAEAAPRLVGTAPLRVVPGIG